jgi:Helix-turn-helix domain
MSVRALAWAIDQKIEDHAEKLLLICLANYANAENECFPSWKALMRDAVMSRPTLARKLQGLRDGGVIRVVERFNEKGGRMTSLYRLRMEGWENDFPPGILIHVPSEPT